VASAAGSPIRDRPYAHHLYASVAPKSAEDVLKIWDGRALVVAPHDPAIVRHHIAATADVLDRLRAEGLTVEVESDDFQALIDASYERWSNPPPRVSGTAVTLPAFFDQVRDLAPIFTFLDEQAQNSKGRAKVSVLGRAWQGNDVKVVRISSAPDDGDRATVFVTSTHHAYEWLSPMIGTGIVWALVNGYETDPNVKKIVDNLNVYVVPVLNPDSYVKTHMGDRMRRTNQNPSCAAGVDLNRNWPSVGWGQGVGACGSQFYPGIAALSEPETKAAKALADGLRKLVWYLDFHTQSAQVMIPYAWTKTKPANYAKAKEIAEQYGAIIGLAAHDGFDLGQGSGGGALDYFQEILDARKGFSHVVEERGVAYDPPSDGVPPYVDKNITAFVTIAAKIADENPAGGTGPDAGGTGGGGAAGGGGVAGSGGSGGMGSGAGGSGGGAGGSPGGAAGSSGGDAGSPARGGSAGAIDAGAMGAGGRGTSSGTTGAGGADAKPGSDAGGCGCRLDERGASPHGLAAIVMAIASVVVRRRQRRLERSTTGTTLL
jgi:hypothetical protein